MTSRSPNPEERRAVILAAGKGTRMDSDLAKVLHEAAGRPLLGWVLDAARDAGCSRLLVVVGHQAERVKRAFAGVGDVDWVLQERQLGTGHALLQAAVEVEGDPLLLVLSGDAPLVRPETLESLVEAVERDGAWGAMLVADLDEPGSLGRVVPREDDGTLLSRIVESSDATAEELRVRTVNSGMYALPAAGIVPYLEGLDPDNAKGELYLTDALVAAAADGRSVRLVVLDDPTEAFGVNTPEELERAERVLTARRGGA